MVILLVFVSCGKKEKEEEIIPEETIVEEPEPVEDTVEEPLELETIPSEEEMASLAASAVEIYKETRIEERPLYPVVGDDSGLYYLQFVYLEEMEGYVLESGPYYRGTLYIPKEIEGIPVVGIADYAFVGSLTLTGIGPLPETIKIIGKKAFCDCSYLRGELVLPSSLETVGEYAFSNTSIDGTLAVPSSVKEIKEGAFKSTRISSIMMDEGIESIGAYAFAYNSVLSGDIYIPSSVKTIDGTAFDHCYGLDGSYLVTPKGFFRVSIE